MTEANRNLLQRIGSALVLVPLLLWLTWRGGAGFTAMCALAAGVGAAELVGMLAGVGLPEAFGIAVTVLFASSPLLAAGALPPWMPVAVPLAGMLLLTLLLLGSELESVPRRASAVALAWVYVAAPVAAVVSLRLRFGFGWVLMAFAVTWLNDTFAYFTGRFLGRHRMFPRVSPKKTWEGFAGGVVGSVAAALVLLALDPAHDLVGLAPSTAVLLALGAAALGPLGDLAESMLKRGAGVKDSGRLIPGHGGLLDRIDALLFVAPWVWLFAALGR